MFLPAFEQIARSSDPQKRETRARICSCLSDAHKSNTCRCCRRCPETHICWRTKANMCKKVEETDFRRGVLSRRVGLVMGRVINPRSLFFCIAMLHIDFHGPIRAFSSMLQGGSPLSQSCKLFSYCCCRSLARGEVTVVAAAGEGGGRRLLCRLQQCTFVVESLVPDYMRVATTRCRSSHSALCIV